MPDNFDADEQLRKLREASKHEFKKVINQSGMIMMALSLILASSFMYLFSISPRRPIDILWGVITIVVTVFLFAFGLKRYLE